MHITLGMILCLCLALVYFIIALVYNVFFHPLARFPGPFHHRASILLWAYLAYRGTLAARVLELHEKYGSVVRISPSHLCFSDPEAWKDIYGAKSGEENLRYRGFYQCLSGRIADSFVGADTEKHRYMKGLIADGFTTRSIAAHEARITFYVDVLMHKLHKHCDSGNDEVDLSSWFSKTALDIICDLTLGQNLRCLETEETHPYLKFTLLFTEYSMKIAVLWHLGLQPLLDGLLYCFGGRMMKMWDGIKVILDERSTIRKGRGDLIEPMIEARDSGIIPPEEVLGNANALVAAGSDTATKAFTIFIYYLLASPECLDRLTNEIRSTIESDDQINLRKAASLPYLNACIKEMLRLSMMPMGMPRVTGRDGRIIAGHYVPEETVISVWGNATTHLASNFRHADEFRPERVLGQGEYKEDNWENSQPFLLGPRACMGKSLFYAEIQLIMTKLLWNFDVQPNSESKMWLNNRKTYWNWDYKPLIVKLHPTGCANHRSIGA